jgi:hypothetical protein
MARAMKTKETVTFRLTKGIKRRLAQAARRLDLSMSEFVEEAIVARLDQAQVPDKPDFRKHFAEHPLIDDGGEALQSLLEEREKSL